MHIRTLKKLDELEIVEIDLCKGLCITVEAFKVPDGFKSFARNALRQQEDLIGSGTHRSKKESILFAIKDLKKSIVRSK